MHVHSYVQIVLLGRKHDVLNAVPWYPDQFGSCPTWEHWGGGVYYPTTRGRLRFFGITSGEFSCHPSLVSIQSIICGKQALFLTMRSVPRLPKRCEPPGVWFSIDEAESEITSVPRAIRNECDWLSSGFPCSLLLLFKRVLLPLSVLREDSRWLMEHFPYGDVCHERPAETNQRRRRRTCQPHTACKSNQIPPTSGGAWKYFDQYSAQHATRAWATPRCNRRPSKVC